MIKNSKNKQSGFIALISTIIISALLLTITVALNLTGFFGRYNILDSELKETSLSLAEACADTAILKLQSNPSYSPSNEQVLVDSDKCNIASISPPASWPKVIQVQAKYPQTDGKFYCVTSGVNTGTCTNLQITVSEPVDEIVIQSWQEVNNF